MALTQIIKDLLYLNEKLVIPGFGGFLAQHIPAQINTDKHILMAPGKYFIFDSTMVEDDGVLVNYISTKNSVSLQEASLQVKEMVNGFMKKLDHGNTLIMDQIGYFVKDEKGIIRFKRDEEQNFLPDSFGLPPVEIRLPSPETHLPEEEYIPERKSRLVRILFIFLAINVIGAISAVIYWKFDDIKSYFSRFSTQNAVAPVVHDSVKHQYQPSSDTSALGQYIDTSTNIKNALRYEEVQKTNIDSSLSEKSYYVIAGSFQSYPKAELFASTLKKQGFTPEVIEFSKNLFRISVGEYKNKDEALKQLETVKSKKGTEKAWLLVK